MKISIKYKYTLVIVGLMIFIFLAFYLYINFGMEAFANARKRSAIKYTIEQIEEYCNDGWNNENARELTKDAGIMNFEIMVYHSSGHYGNMVYRTSENIETLVNRFAIFIQSQNFSADYVYEQTEKYVIYDTFDGNMEGWQIECMGFYNGYYYVISTSLSGIIESVSVTSEFFTYLSIFVTIIAIAISILVGFEFARPIEKLAKQSEKISRLDFSDKYDGKRSDEIGTLGQNMNTMSDKLSLTIHQLEDELAEKERINRSQIDFISNTSHELKTPIAVIQGYAEGLRDGIADDKESVDFYTSVIVDEVEHMHKIITRMLSLDELESGHYNIEVEEFNLVEVIKGILEKLQPSFSDDEVKIKLIAPEEIIINSDALLIEQIITNYINNACRHVSIPGSITINAGVNNDEIYVTVHNTGEEIPQEDIPRLWDKFYKVDKSHAERHDGSGIGLSFVKLVIQQLGGECFVRNTGDGVVFGISLKESETQNYESEEISQ